VKLKLQKFLEENDFLPIEKWNCFRIDHKKPKSETEKQNVREFIKSQTKNCNGLYIYADETGNIIYVGKGKPITNRLLSHYRECYEGVPGDTKDKRWHRFFSSNQGNLMVYWIELEDEENRQLIEYLLSIVLNPTFKHFR
jgi:hypothetical protein